MCQTHQTVKQSLFMLLLLTHHYIYPRFQQRVGILSKSCSLLVKSNASSPISSNLLPMQYFMNDLMMFSIGIVGNSSIGIKIYNIRFLPLVSNSKLELIQLARDGIFGILHFNSLKRQIFKGWNNDVTLLGIFTAAKSRAPNESHSKSH